jgi:hypothetical protein
MHFAKATRVKQQKLSVWAAAVYLALFFVIAAVSQLFGFETFSDIIATYGLPANDVFNKVAAALIVILEVFAIPFLLMMRLSLLMRVVSMVAGWLVLIFWLAVGVWQSMVSFYIPNAGLFGSKIDLPQGWWLVFYMVALITLTVYVSYHLWPIISRRHRVAKK